MDCEALQQLNDLGYSDLTGFKVIASDAKDRIECYTSHPLNGKYAGQHRDCRQSFWSSQAYSLQPLSGKAVSLSSLVDYSGTQRAACTMGIYENRLGGRICVSGYFPWSFLENGAKSTQMKAVMLWLSKDSLPAYVASFHKINVWVRKTQDGVRALTLTNSSFDEAQNVVLCLKTAASYIEVLDMDCKIMKRNLAILGSTGSIGTQALQVVDEHPDLFEVYALTANNQVDLLINQARKYMISSALFSSSSLLILCIPIE